MINQVAAPCCGSCEHCKGSAIGLRCYERTPYEVTGLRNSCMEGRNYSPCNPIPIIDIPGVKELKEALLTITYLVHPADSLKVAQALAEKALEDKE